jgi:hypothetical protein
MNRREKHTIAGKTIEEILSWKNGKRCCWYKTLSPEEKAEVMRIVKTEGCAKISGKSNPMYGRTGKNAPFYGRTHTEDTKNKMSESWTLERKTKMSVIKRGKALSEEHKAKIGASMMGHSVSEMTKDKMSISHMGMKNHNFGKPLTEEIKTKISAAHAGKTLTEEHKAKLSGKNNHFWKGGVSFEPYCPAFNNGKKEHIRNLCNRTCTVCGENILRYFRAGKRHMRLHVDHLDENKMQGCNDWKWRLTALCPSCHRKMQNPETHLLLQLLLLNNKNHQTNFLFVNKEEFK